MNTVRVVEPPAVIERGRNVQYANREALNSRLLTQKIITEARRRKKIRKKLDPNNQEKAGGRLDLTSKDLFRLKRRRRSFEPGYFLRPSGPPFIIESAFEYPIALNVYDVVHAYAFGYTFGVANGNNVITPGTLSINTTSQFVSPANGQTYTNYFTGSQDSGILQINIPRREVDSQCTLEFFGHFPSGGFTPLASETSYTNQQGTGYVVTNSQSAFAGFSFSCTSNTDHISFRASKTTTFNIPSLAPGSFISLTGLSDFWAYEVVSEYTAGWLTNELLASQNPPLLPDISKIHFALTEKNKTLSLYINGSLVHTQALQETGFLEHPLSFGQGSSKLISSGGVASDRNSVFSTMPQGRVNISEIRLTSGQVLYSGNYFVPPNSISDLA